MINTVEGKKLKKGQNGWEVGFDPIKDLFVPTIHRVHIDPLNDSIYYSHSECAKKCDELNDEKP